MEFAEVVRYLFHLISLFHLQSKREKIMFSLSVCKTNRLDLTRLDCSIETHWNWQRERERESSVNRSCINNNVCSTIRRILTNYHGCILLSSVLCLMYLSWCKRKHATKLPPPPFYCRCCGCGLFHVHIYAILFLFANTFVHLHKVVVRVVSVYAKVNISFPSLSFLFSFYRLFACKFPYHYCWMSVSKTSRFVVMFNLRELFSPSLSSFRCSIDSIHFISFDYDSLIFTQLMIVTYSKQQKKENEARSTNAMICGCCTHYSLYLFQSVSVSLYPHVYLISFIHLLIITIDKRISQPSRNCSNANIEMIGAMHIVGKRFLIFF